MLVCPQCSGFGLQVIVDPQNCGFCSSVLLQCSLFEGHDKYYKNTSTRLQESRSDVIIINNKKYCTFSVLTLQNGFLNTNVGCKLSILIEMYEYLHYKTLKPFFSKWLFHYTLTTKNTMWRAPTITKLSSLVINNILKICSEGNFNN